MKRVLMVMAISIFLGIGCASLPPPQAQIRVPANFIRHQLDGREWKVGYQNGNQQDFASEWVLPGESVQEWTELLTAQVHFADQNLSDVVAVFRQQLAHGSRDFQFAVLDEKLDTVLLEWSHKGSGQWPAQREIRRIMRGKDGIYMLAYAVTESAFSQAHYEIWKKNIAEAKLEPMAKQ